MVLRSSYLIAWPDQPTRDWRLGYLAGIFDAEGSHSQGVLRISNSDAEILGQIGESLAFFDFDFVVEPPRPNGVSSVRIRGGMSEQLRFTSLVDPAILRKRSVCGNALKLNTNLAVQSVEPSGSAPSYIVTTSVGTVVANGLIAYSGHVSHALSDSGAHSSASPRGEIR